MSNTHYLAMVGAMKELMEWGRPFEKRAPWVSPYGLETRMSFEDDITLEDPPAEDPRVIQHRAEGWADLPYGAAYCGPCGNSRGLMFKGDEVKCRACMAYGHAAAYSPEQEDDAALDLEEV